VLSLRHVLGGRLPTSAELRSCTREQREGILPSGVDDVAFAERHFREHGRLPGAADWEHADLTEASGGFKYYTGKARAVRKADSPSMREVENSPELESPWGDPIHDLIQRGIEEGLHHFLTPEEMAEGAHKILPLIWVRTTKESGVLKVRLAPHGGKESANTFAPFSTSAACPSMDTTKLVLAFAAFLDLT
jgi:hypothetical protein